MPALIQASSTCTWNIPDTNEVEVKVKIKVKIEDEIKDEVA